MKSKAVIFDIDGTISPEVSWLALTRDLGASVEHHQAIFDAYRGGQLDYPMAKHQLIELWQATGQANQDTMTHHFERWPLDPAALPLVKELTVRGYQLCLITGSVDLYAKTMAHRLGIKHYYANTELTFDSAGDLTDFTYELNQGPKKLVQLEEFCRTQNLEPEDCIIIGDGDSELEMFRRTGRGILLDRPDQSAELKAAAWQHISQLSEARNYLFSH